jgi:hypothetical protein
LPFILFSIFISFIFFDPDPVKTTVTKHENDEKNNIFFNSVALCVSSVSLCVIYNTEETQSYTEI